MERPVIMSAPMVRAIIAGRKSTTRRVIKDDWFRCLDPDTPEDLPNILAQCPYGVAGDRLWVRETFSGHAGNFYRADGDVQLPPRVRWCSPMLMPRRASRLTLTIESVYIERLQEITEEGAEAEGVLELDGTLDTAKLCARAKAMGACPEDARVWFAELWDSINGAHYPWRSNPWVWVLNFQPEAK